MAVTHLQGMTNIKDMVTRRADKKPPRCPLLFFKHGMKPVFIPAGWADFKFLFYIYIDYLIVHRIFLKKALFSFVNVKNSLVLYVCLFRYSGLQNQCQHNTKN